jgi:peptidyl-tRNA hydrolase
VLSNFSRDELVALPRLLDGVVELLKLTIAEGLPKAMTLYHNKELLEG